MNPIDFGNRRIGDGEPAFVIAEAGVNHNGDLELGRALIREAAAAGADAIKFQSYKAGKISTKTAPRYWVEADDPDGSQYDTFKKLDSFGPEEHEELFRYAKDQGILCFSAPFDDEAVDMLDELGAPGFKIASADLTDHPLLKHAASKGKPVVLSTGLATIAEIGEAVSVVRGTGNEKLVLLHCTLQYPCAPENANLRMMLHMKAAFPDIPVGISDHTLGIAVPQAAVALGAVAVEKHYTVDKTLPGSPDHYLSVDPRDLKEMVSSIRTIEKAMGRYLKGPIEAESQAYKFARRSIVSKTAIPRGTSITREMLTFKRPGTGIYPKHVDQVVGRTARVDVPEDTVLEWGMI
ncbi:MAG TPA: N-acetylneuraminate synthase family protein [Vicinamibacteria bacterium]|nr:N-acetylneuraminate synthase family protein [Vicinamibacteria bacterium]